MAFWWYPASWLLLHYYYCNVLCSINIIISLWEHHLTCITCKLQFWVEFIFKVFTKDRGTPSTCHKKNINIELKYNPIFNYQFSRNGCTVIQDVNHNMVIKQICALNNINITGYFFFLVYICKPLPGVTGRRPQKQRGKGSRRFLDKYLFPYYLQKRFVFRR